MCIIYVYNLLLAGSPSSAWSVWSAHTDCSATCGWGIQSKTRTCLGDPKLCIGDSSRSWKCLRRCVRPPGYSPSDGSDPDYTWSAWSNYGL